MSSVRGSWVDMVSHRQLLDSSEPLNEGRIQQQRFPRIKIDTPPNGVVNRLWEKLRMSYCPASTRSAGSRLLETAGYGLWDFIG